MPCKDVYIIFDRVVKQNEHIISGVMKLSNFMEDVIFFHQKWQITATLVTSNYRLANYFNGFYGFPTDPYTWSFNAKCQFKIMHIRCMRDYWLPSRGKSSCQAMPHPTQAAGLPDFLPFTVSGGKIEIHQI